MEGQDGRMGARGRKNEDGRGKPQRRDERRAKNRAGTTDFTTDFTEVVPYLAGIDNGHPAIRLFLHGPMRACKP